MPRIQIKERSPKGGMTKADEERLKSVKTHLIDYLQTEMGIDEAPKLERKGLIHCISPDHPDKTPSMGMYYGSDGTPRLKCFSCGRQYDLIDVIMEREGKTFPQAVKRANHLYGDQPEDPINKQATYTQATQAFRKDYVIPRDETDFTNEVNRAHTRLLHPDSTLDENADKQSRYHLDYLQKTRGLSRKTIEDYQIGITWGMNNFLQDHTDKWNKWMIPGDGGKPPVSEELLYTVVLPYPGEHGTPHVEFVATDREQLQKANERYQRSRVNRNAGKYAIPKGTSKILLNERYITGVSPAVIWITEGYFDALSIEQSGGRAIAIGGTGGVNRLLKLIQENPHDSNYIVCLDNDEKGKEAAGKLMKGLETIPMTYAINCTVEESFTGIKDANEALVKYPDQLKEFVKKKEIELQKHIQEVKTGEIEAYKEHSASKLLDGFMDRVRENTSNPIPTGFKTFDKCLDGGLYPGLYFIGAISSLGKTSFCLQMMDQIAELGHDVLIFSLEMASDELIAKSISRNTYYEACKHQKGTALAKTTRGIMSGHRYDKYQNDEMLVINRAIDKYKSYSDHIFIHEGLGNIGYDDVKKAVSQHINMTGNKPVVLIDYLQILAPDEDHIRASDKQINDKNVLELKRLSRDFKIPVVAISSFNRENYNSPVNLASFKESGAIEYTSDVLIGLQYEGMDYQEAKTKSGTPSGSDESDTKRTSRIRSRIQDIKERAKEGKPVPVQLKILKQRNAAQTDCFFDFTPKFNVFEETSGESNKTVTYSIKL